MLAIEREGGAPMAVWSIKIEPGNAPDAPAKFVPQLQEGGPQGLLARAGDLVSWNNATDEAHQPWPTDANYKPLTPAQVGPRGGENYLSDEIPPDHSSRPSWVVTVSPVTQNTIYYCCKLHPDMHGVITITPTS
jgi:plastocyanin